MSRTSAFAMFAAGCLTASIGGLFLRAADMAHADVTKTPPREAFKAGSERSEVILREIADLLKKIDGRLERIEQAAARGVTPPARK